MKKPRSGARLQVRGAVRSMNLARQALSAGLHPGSVESFRRQVLDSIAELEAICRKHRITPQELPGPSRQAYLYLKSIDLERLPLQNQDSRPAAAPPQSPNRVAFRGLLAFCDRLQEELGALAGAGNGVDLEPVRGRIRETVAPIEAGGGPDRLSPADLAPPSRRAYGWLKFLLRPGRLELHLQALRRARQAAEKAACRRGLPLTRRKLPVQVTFFNTATLYRARARRGVLHQTASEAFIGAGPEVMEALVCAALGAGGEKAAQTLRAYADSPAFAGMLAELAPPEAERDSAARGRHFDLMAVFERVNREYFEGRVERPRLVWNSTLTRRKLGHYQPASDTVLISITLDQPGIPEAVIDFVMYHELLHKDLGIPIVNGRRQAHSPAFRRAEKKFRQFAEVQEFLKTL